MEKAHRRVEILDRKHSKTLLDAIQPLSLRHNERQHFIAKQIPSSHICDKGIDLDPVADGSRSIGSVIF